MVNPGKHEPKDCILLLHNIRSVQNAGSLFRTSDAFGIKKIWLSGFTATPIDRFNKSRKDFIKTSLGSEKAVPWEYAKTLSEVIKKVKAEGYAVVAIEQDVKSLDYTDPSAYRGKKVALLLGNEVRGIDARTLKLCDRIVEIPMRGMKESLNVSVAGALVISRIAHN